MRFGKTWFCKGMVSKLERMGFPTTQMDYGLYGIQEVFGQASFLPNPYQKMVPPGLPRFGENGRGGLAPSIFPIDPLWAYRPIQLLIHHPRWPAGRVRSNGSEGVVESLTSLGFAAEEYGNSGHG